MKAAIIDYGVGNLDSVVRIVEECGSTAVIAVNSTGIEEATHIILPGVGSFTAAMENIRKKELDRALHDHVRVRGIPLLGICLGMQLLATKGWEGGETPGLGWIPGEVRRLTANGNGERVPHMGWNQIDIVQRCPLFNQIPSAKDFYFAHSYVMDCRDPQNVVATTAYCGQFASAVREGRIFGVQFHPEKSQRFGRQLVKNFLAA